MAVDKKCDWVLLLDQDSVVSGDMIRIMLNEYSRKLNQERIGLVCPDILLSDKKSHQFPLRFRRLISTKVTETSDNVDFAITSGSMIKSCLFDVIGVMDDVFFIDYIDYDFCLRLRMKGYKILYVRDAVLTHSLGEKKLSKLGIQYTSHAAKRVYYQTRNRLIVVRRYGLRFPSFALAQVSLLVLKLFKIVIIEDQKTTRLRNYFIGILHSFHKIYR
jgi:rhamnosyltransferase